MGADDKQIGENSQRSFRNNQP